MNPPDNKPPDPPRYHFAGVAGSGMSALAQFHLLRGGAASGSDRSFDAGDPDPAAQEIRRRLEALGLRVHRQDGSAFAEAIAADALVVSTAVEETVPDVRAARARGATIVHRSELLAEIVRDHRTIAVTGTSGKSTVTAMIFEVLEGAGLSPSVITGGDLLLLRSRGLLGNAWAGRSDLLVIEADESDGSLVRYEPWMGVLLNLQRDHKEPEELARIFETFRRRVRGPFILGEEANLGPFAGGAERFGFGPDCRLRGQDVSLEPERSRFIAVRRASCQEAASEGTVSDAAACEAAACELPIPGEHNVRNALAALAATTAAGLPLATGAQALRGFSGVARRFQRIGRARGVEVIDDFAHNPEKIRASLAAARLRAPRLLAFYQPHGFGPTRFLRDGLIEAFAGGLGPADRLYLSEIFYAGGTAQKDISSGEIVREVGRRGVPALFAPRREDLIGPIAADARAGDLILVMGARDPSLTEFCRAILRRLEETTDEP